VSAADLADKLNAFHRTNRNYDLQIVSLGTTKVLLVYTLKSIFQINEGYTKVPTAADYAQQLKSQFRKPANDRNPDSAAVAGS